MLEILAPQVGLEPTTLRLTAECSAIELLRNKRPRIVATMLKGAGSFYNKWTWHRQEGLQFERRVGAGAFLTCKFTNGNCRRP